VKEEETAEAAQATAVASRVVNTGLVQVAIV